MVQSVERALMILGILDKIENFEKGMGVSDLSKVVKLKFSTVHNLLQTLVQLEYVEKISESRKYRLGKKALDLGRNHINRKSLLRTAEPIVIALSKEINETVLVILYNNGKRYTLLQVESQQDLKVTTSSSIDTNFYNTATGRVLLTNLMFKELEEYVKGNGFPGAKWDKIKNLTQLKKRLNSIKQQGHAFVSNQQVTAIGVPVYNSDNHLNATLGVYLPSVRFKNGHKDVIIAGLKQAASDILVRLEN